MKIAILGATNIKHMSLLSHYLNNIDLDKNTIDIIYTDKYNQDEVIDGISNYYKFNVNIDPKWSFIKKALEYYKFKPFATKLLKENKYDFVIVWGSYTGHLFKNILTSKFKNRYILNIRDYFFEKNILVQKRMKSIVNSSFLTTLSSEGFYEFLPKSNKYQVIYSYNMNVINKSDVHEINKQSMPIRLGFIGNVRFKEINQTLMNELANDARFELQYFGTGSEELAEYAKNNNINNVTFSGSFNVEDTYKFLNKIDVLNNLYGNKNIALDTALSIRMYYALFLNKPIITTKETFTEKESEKFGLGFSVDPEHLEGIGDKLAKWYTQLNDKTIQEKREKYINKVIENNEKFYSLLREKFNV